MILGKEKASTITPKPQLLIPSTPKLLNILSSTQTLRGGSAPEHPQDDLHLPRKPYSP